jgi:hypothetical protein
MVNETNETISFIAAVKIAVIVISVKSSIRIGLKKNLIRFMQSLNTICTLFA